MKGGRPDDISKVHHRRHHYTRRLAKDYLTVVCNLWTSIEDPNENNTLSAHLIGMGAAIKKSIPVVDEYRRS